MYDQHVDLEMCFFLESLLRASAHKQHNKSPCADAEEQGQDINNYIEKFYVYCLGLVGGCVRIPSMTRVYKKGLGFRVGLWGARAP